MRIVTNSANTTMSLTRFSINTKMQTKNSKEKEEQVKGLDKSVNS